MWRPQKDAQRASRGAHQKRTKHADRHRAAVRPAAGCGERGEHCREYRTQPPIAAQPKVIQGQPAVRNLYKGALLIGLHAIALHKFVSVGHPSFVHHVLHRQIRCQSCPPCWMKYECFQWCDDRQALHNAQTSKSFATQQKCFNMIGGRSSANC